MKGTYFNEKLANLTSFEGFVPRWYIPATDIYSKDDSSNHATQTLSIIDTALEIKVGVGFDWPPVILGKKKIQLPEQMAQFLKRNLGDDVYFDLDLSPLFGVQNANAHLLQLMTLEMPDTFVDTQRNVINFKGQEVHLKELGLV